MNVSPADIWHLRSIVTRQYEQPLKDSFPVPYDPSQKGTDEHGNFRGFDGIWGIQSGIRRQDDPPKYRWDTGVNRYRDTATGRFVARTTILDYVGRSLQTSMQSVENLATWVSDGWLSVSDWQNAFRQELKLEYIRQYLSGIGGRQMMTQADWGSIGGMLREQYGYLDNFARGIASGNLSQGQIRARMQMYINSAREAHERAHAKTAQKWGADEVAWILGIADHCDTCVTRASQGWKPIGPKGGFPDPLAADGEAFPGSGDSECLCITTPEKLVLTKRGWIPMLDVVVGDMVFTHKLRWRPVYALVAKPVTADTHLVTVNGVGCTHGHLWYTTNRQWIPAAKLSGIDVLLSHAMDSPGGGANLYAWSGEKKPVYILNEGLSLRQVVEGCAIANRDQPTGKPFEVGLSEGGSASVTVAGQLPPDITIFDLTVEEDCSFCIEGVFAHNTNCACSLAYRNSVTGQEFEG